MRSIFLASLFFLFFGIPVFGQRGEFDWHQRCIVHWENAPLRDTLTSLADQYKNQFGFVLDRRVPPETPVAYKSDTQTFEQVFSGIARENDLSFCTLGSIAYIGPKDAAGELLLMKSSNDRRMESFPDAAKRTLERRMSFRTKMLETPQDVLKRLMADQPLVWYRLETLPHDLWPAYNLPTSSRSDFLTIFLFGFGERYLISNDGKRITHAEIDKELEARSIFPDKIDIEPFRETFPNITAEFDGKQTVLKGTFADLGRIEHLLWRIKQSKLANEAAKKNPLPANVERYYTLKITQQKAVDVIPALAQRFDIKIEFDRATIGVDDLETRVSVDVTGASIKELLEELLAPINAEIIINEDESIRIRKRSG